MFHYNGYRKCRAAWHCATSRRHLTADEMQSLTVLLTAHASRSRARAGIANRVGWEQQPLRENQKIRL
jgi:hypothetical protein